MKDDLPPLVYIAGPYRAQTRAGVENNINTARQIGVLAARKGYSPVIPHSNTAFLDELAPELGDQFWLDATMAMMLVCTAVVLVPGWERSSGTRDEISWAKRAGIPVYASIDELPQRHLHYTNSDSSISFPT